jgi:hypothetical protein
MVYVKYIKYTDGSLAIKDGLCRTEPIAAEVDSSVIIVCMEIYNDGK